MADLRGLTVYQCVPCVLVTDHPDHDVGEASDPEGGGEEGDHEPPLPAPLGTVGDGEEQKQGQRPHGQPLQLVEHTRWRRT